MDLNGDILYEKPLSLPKNLSPSEFAAIMKNTIHAILEAKPYKPQELAGFVLTLPGTINSAEGKLILSVELGWQNIHVTDLFADMFGNHVYLERSLNLLALSEASKRKKANKASHIQLFIFDHAGIGLSTVIHGNIQHGAHYMHGELGHMKLFSDVVCFCGQRGCLEAIIKQLLEKNNGAITDEILEYFSLGIAAAVSICDTDVILTGSYVDRMTPAQKQYLKNSISSKITSSDTRNFDIDFLYNSKQAAQHGLCAYMFDCCFPTN